MRGGLFAPASILAPPSFSPYPQPYPQGWVAPFDSAGAVAHCAKWRAATGELLWSDERVVEAHARDAALIAKLTTTPDEARLACCRPAREWWSGETCAPRGVAQWLNGVLRCMPLNGKANRAAGWSDNLLLTLGAVGGVEPWWCPGCGVSDLRFPGYGERTIRKRLSSAPDKPFGRN